VSDHGRKAQPLSIADEVLAERYRAGERLSHLAEAAGTWPDGVRRRLVRLGVPIQRRGMGRGDAVRMAEQMFGGTGAKTIIRMLMQAGVFAKDGYGRNAAPLGEREVLSLVLACALGRVMSQTEAVEVVRNHGDTLVNRLRECVASGGDFEFEHRFCEAMSLCVTLHGAALQALAGIIDA
jgi:hypothetical protein